MRKIKVSGVTKQAEKQERLVRIDTELEYYNTMDATLRGVLDYMRTMTDNYIELEKRVKELENK